MKSQDGQIRLSATDLANHLACRHLTTLDLAEARGHAKRPIWNDPALAVLRERGFQHEASYLDYLRSRGHSVVRLDDRQEGDSAFEKTKAAMQAGEEIIVQATLANDRWFGRADILQRVDRPSKLGEWSYEVIDTKLARETRAGTILQLCLYSDIVCEVQGTPPEHMPEHMYVVSPARGLEPEEFRVQDYLAYYRFVKRRLETEVDRSHGSLGASTYPDPVSHCDICLWLPDCKQKRHDDDHLCLVAGISKLQRTELQDRGIHSLESLADIPVPLSWRPKRGSSDGYERVREQARVQREGRRKESPVHELLPPEVDRGLARLPEPSAGDIFFDIEGDLFVGESGLEYLFGYVVFDDSGEPTYRQQWALNQKEERGQQEGVAWTDREGSTHSLTLDDILIVAPYNAQVADLSKRLPGARVGTVDKFQGQQAPVIIYSMTTSSPDEAPRGMGFLYSLNRLNVATSRARCVCFGCH